MRNKAMIIWIALFFASTGLLGAQYMADSFGITLTSLDGNVELESNILNEIIDLSTINTSTVNAVNANYTDNSTFYNRVETPDIASAYVAWEILQVMTGTYAFNLLILLGIPSIFVVPLAIVYVLLLGWFIWSAIRGI